MVKIINDDESAALTHRFREAFREEINELQKTFAHRDDFEPLVHVPIPFNGGAPALLAASSAAPPTLPPPPALPRPAPLTLTAEEREVARQMGLEPAVVLANKRRVLLGEEARTSAMGESVRVDAGKLPMDVRVLRQGDTEAHGEVLRFAGLVGVEQVPVYAATSSATDVEVVAKGKPEVRDGDLWITGIDWPREADGQRFLTPTFEGTRERDGDRYVTTVEAVTRLDVTREAAKSGPPAGTALSLTAEEREVARQMEINPVTLLAHKQRVAAARAAPAVPTPPPARPLAPVMLTSEEREAARHLGVDPAALLSHKQELAQGAHGGLGAGTTVTLSSGQVVVLTAEEVEVARQLALAVGDVAAEKARRLAAR